MATYEEIRLRFALGGIDQARIKAKRRCWPAEPPNHPGAVTRIRVPREAWDAAPAEIERVRSWGSAPPNPDQFHQNKLLIDAVAAFREAEARLLAERDAARAEVIVERSRADRNEGKAKALRDAVAREIRQAEQAEEAWKAAETWCRAAEASRDATQAELAAWTAGRPLTQTWRAFWNRRGRP